MVAISSVNPQYTRVSCESSSFGRSTRSDVEPREVRAVDTVAAWEESAVDLEVVDAALSSLRFSLRLEMLGGTVALSPDMFLWLCLWLWFWLWWLWLWLVVVKKLGFMGFQRSKCAELIAEVASVNVMFDDVQVKNVCETTLFGKERL